MVWKGLHATINEAPDFRDPFIIAEVKCDSLGCAFDDNPQQQLFGRRDKRPHFLKVLTFLLLNFLSPFMLTFSRYLEASEKIVGTNSLVIVKQKTDKKKKKNQRGEDRSERIAFTITQGKRTMTSFPGQVFEDQ